MRFLIVVITFILASFCLHGQNKYFLSFSNKDNNPYSISLPYEFLTEKSIERRIKQGISITERDLPVSPIYINELKETGAKVLYTLRWFNGAVVEANSPIVINAISQLEFVIDIKLIFDNTVKASQAPEDEIFPTYSVKKTADNYYQYGHSWNQISMLNGHKLHNKGYRGKGITIAVLDAGFFKTNSLPSFDSLWADSRVIYTKDFVNQTSNIYEEHPHGMLVLSVLAANLNGQLIGSAPEANYVLIRSEDTNSEQVIEEYNWAAAAELADSLGVDIINSSLGYNKYDASWQSYTYDQLDGRTTIAAQAANYAFDRGMLVVNSAGNEGLTDWMQIITPADAFGAIAVGSIDKNKAPSFFSSTGPSSDGRIKPDLMALGELTAVQSANGNIGLASGTSFSAPIISGLAACLWQALPHLSANEVRTRIIQSSSNYNKPNSVMGFGYPNFSIALDSIPVEVESNRLYIYPNPTLNKVNIWIPNDLQSSASELTLISNTGTIVKNEQIPPNLLIHTFYIPEYFPSGIYFVKLISGNQKRTGKLIKYKQ
jgi:serine protease AprX